MATEPPDKEPGRDDAALSAEIDALNREKTLARERRLRAEAEFDDLLRNARERLTAASPETPAPVRPGETPGSARLREEMRAWTALTGTAPEATQTPVALTETSAAPTKAPPEATGTPAAATAIAAPRPSSIVPPSPVAPGVDAGVPVPLSALPAPPVVSPGSPVSPVSWQASQPVEADRPRTRGKGVALAAVAGTLFAALTLWFVIGGRTGEETRSTTASKNGPSSGPAPVASPAPERAGADPAIPAPEATTPATAPLSLDITTIRGVWLRVLVDGERMIERELPADDTRRFEGKSTIAVRTGDAGALRLRLNGRELDPLGRDGEVVSRSFTLDDIRSPR